MSRMLGVSSEYYALSSVSQLDNYSESTKTTSIYDKPISIYVIFESYPDQKTLKKHGWVSELSEGSSIIHVAYDLPNLSVGARFTFPSGLDEGKPRIFQVIKMQNIMIYPASITCEVAPVYDNVDAPVITKDFTQDTSTLLVDLEEDD